MTKVRAALGLALTLPFLPRHAASQVADPFSYTNPSGRHEASLTPLLFRSTAKFDVTRNGQEFKNQPFGRSGYGVAFDYLYNIASSLAVGAEWMYIAREGAQVPGFWPDSSNKALGDSHLLLATLRLKAGVGRVRGYALGGVGIHQTQFDLVTTPHGNTPWPGGGTEGRPWIRSREKGLGGAARVGMEYAFDGGGVLGLEGGYVFMAPKNYASKVPGATGASDVRVGGNGYMLGARFGVRIGR